MAEGVVGTGVEVKFRACAGQLRMKTTENEQARAAPWVRSSARLCMDGSSAAQHRRISPRPPGQLFVASCLLSRLLRDATPEHHAETDVLECCT